MFRTRDFILFLVTIAFLIMSIGAVIIERTFGSSQPGSEVEFISTEDREYSADVVTSPPLSHEQKLADMRQKISDGTQVKISEPKPEVVPEEEGDDSEPEVPAEVVQKCPSYANFGGQWLTEGIKIELQEGVRIVYKEFTGEANLDSLNATSGPPFPVGIQKDILLELPAYPVRTAIANCINSDVVGIAKDGSLIRNGEVGTYSLFPESVVIGYALDGHPIFGVSETKTDSCGGYTVAGQYGYYLSKDRAVVLNCFVAKPIQI